MKKYLKISFIVLGVLVLGAMLSSCNNNIDPMSGKVSYIATGSVSGGNFIMPPVTGFQNAINNAVGSGFVQPNDSKVIAACDNYHNSIKSDTSLDGNIKIVKKAYSGGSETVLKQYTYKKSK